MKIKRFMAVVGSTLASLIVVSGMGTMHVGAQALPAAGKVPTTVKPDRSNVPDLIEVSDSNDNSMKVVGYARKADVFKTAASIKAKPDLLKGILDVYDRTGTKRVGRLHPNGSGFVPTGVTTIPPATSKPIVRTSSSSIASFAAGPETTFTGHIYDPDQNLHYCGAMHSQVGEAPSHMGWGAAFTRPVLWYGACNLGTAPTIWGGYLSVNVTMIRSGQICAQTEYVGNYQPTAILGLQQQMCSNPFGVQTWVTVGGHHILDPVGGGMEGGSSMSYSESY